MGRYLSNLRRKVTATPRTDFVAGSGLRRYEPYTRRVRLLMDQIAVAEQAGQHNIVRQLKRKVEVVEALTDRRISALRKIKLLEQNKKLFRRNEFAGALKDLILQYARKGRIKAGINIIRKYKKLFSREEFFGLVEKVILQGARSGKITTENKIIEEFVRDVPGLRFRAMEAYNKGIRERQELKKQRKRKRER